MNEEQRLRGLVLDALKCDQQGLKQVQPITDHLILSHTHIGSSSKVHRLFGQSH